MNEVEAPRLAVERLDRRNDAAAVSDRREHADSRNGDNSVHRRVGLLAGGLRFGWWEAVARQFN
jgi:hypothetical protein